MAEYKDKGCSVDTKIEALRKEARPRVSGRLLAQGSDCVSVQSGGSVIEVPRKWIVDQEERDGGVELTLADDAEIIVSTVVSAQKGFVADNVFGALSRFMAGDNCNCNCSGGNCNCNCGGGGGELMSEAAAARLDALAGGARRFRASASR